MKYLLILALMLTGCSRLTTEYGTVEDEIAKRNSDVEYLTQGCLRIGKCLGVEAKIIHFPNQKHAPYACNIHYGVGGLYLYPDSNFGFGSLSSYAYENAANICELAKQNGQFDPKRVEAERKNMIEWMKQQEEKAKHPKPQPTKETIKIEVSQ